MSYNEIRLNYKEAGKLPFVRQNLKPTISRSLFRQLLPPKQPKFFEILVRFFPIPKGCNLFIPKWCQQYRNVKTNLKTASEKTPWGSVPAP